MKIQTLIVIGLAATMTPVVSFSQQADTAARLEVTLDRNDWLYNTGDTARFTVGLTRRGKPVSGTRVVVEIGQERMPPIRRDTLNVGAGAQVVKMALREPGFLRLSASARLDTVTYRAMATAAISPEKIVATTTMPSDFVQFWESTFAAARRTPLATVMTKIKKWSTTHVDVYHVSFQNDRINSRLYGMLSVPTRTGKFPAVLAVPGAGVRPYFPDTALARLGVVHLRIGIHGIPVDRDSLLYNELRATALAQYSRYGIESRDTYYYKRVFAGVLRAGDFLFSLPKVDTANYVVQGGSQGGGLAIMAGAMDKRVKGIVAIYPAMSDHFAYLAGKPGGWPHHFADTAGMRAMPERMETLRYYDVVNFARLLRVPGFYSWGFNDNTVPPHSAYAAYNLITAPKELFIAKETEHFTVKSQDDRIRAWLLDRLGVEQARQ